MSSPNRRGSVISNCTNDSDIASDCKTPISGQPKKLRKQINNDEFKQNYFELNLSNTSGVQVLAFQPGSDSTPKKRKRSSSTAARRKSVSSVAAEDSNNEDSPQVQTKLNKKRKQSIAASVDTVNTPSEELFSEEGNSLQAIDQSLLNSLSSCDFDSLFKEDERKKDHQLCDNLFLPKSAFKDLKKGRNLACSTTNIQTTSTCSYNLKNSPETPTTSRNRSISNSHPIILNQTNSNTIRKRSNSCVSMGQLSNSQPITTTSCAPIINNNTCTVSPPERLMAKEMKLNAYLSLVREVENCGNSQNSPMTLSSQSGSTPSHIISSGSTAPSNAHFQRFDSNNSYYYDGNHMMPWEVMELPGTIQEQQSHHFNNPPLLSDLVCKQLVNSVFQENQRRAVQSAGLDPSLFEALFNNIQDTIATTDSHQTVNNQIASPTLLPFLSSETLQAMEPSQIQDLIDYLERLQSSKKVSPPQRSTFEDNSASHQSSSESYLMAQDEYHSNDEFMF